MCESFGGGPSVPEAEERSRQRWTAHSLHDKAAHWVRKKCIHESSRILLSMGSVRIVPLMKTMRSRPRMSTSAFLVFSLIIQTNRSRIALRLQAVSVVSEVGVKTMRSPARKSTSAVLVFSRIIKTNRSRIALRLQAVSVVSEVGDEG